MAPEEFHLHTITESSLGRLTASSLRPDSLLSAFLSAAVPRIAVVASSMIETETASSQTDAHDGGPVKALPLLPAYFSSSALFLESRSCYLEEGVQLLLVKGKHNPLPSRL